MSKRILSFVLVLSLILSLSVTFASAEGATRGEVLEMLLDASDFYNPDVEPSDIMHGDEGGLRENDPVTRAEALVMLSRAFGELPELSGENLRTAIPRESFTDIPDWAAEELAPVFDAGLVAGTSAGIFSPSAQVTKEQMELFIDRAYALFGTNPEDDFYASVNDIFLKEFPLPPGYPSYGVSTEVSQMTFLDCCDIILNSVNSYPDRGTARDHIKTLFLNIRDIQSRNAAGISPIKATLDAIDNAKSISDFENIITPDDTSLIVYAILDFWPSVDLKDSSRYVDYFISWTPDLTQDVYRGEADYIKDAHIKHIKNLLTLCGEDEKTAADMAKTYFEYEKKISEAMLPKEKEGNPDYIYNVYTLSQIDDIFKGVDIAKIHKARGVFDGSKIIVSDVGAMKKAAELVTNENIDALRTVLKIKFIMSVAEFLSQDFVDANDEYRSEIYGVDQSLTTEEIAYNQVLNLLSPYVDRLYASKNSSPELISEVTDMTKQIIAEYRNELKNCNWMSESTKERAIKKLDNMKLFIGAPTKFDDPLKDVSLKKKAEGGSYLDSAFTIYKASRKMTEEKAKLPVRRDEWVCPSYEVNAFYSPTNNSITFPLAILQEPFYSKDASFEENLGGIGTTIAHEISHAFDDNGAKYDENGNLTNWWTEEDYKHFEEKCDKTVNFFRGLEVAPGIALNAEVTLGENMADISAMHCINAIGEKTENFDFKKMYEAYAYSWLEMNTRESLELSAMSDTHSANKLRVNRVLQCIDKFYEVYEIDETDGMFEPKEERVKIW